MRTNWIFEPGHTAGEFRARHMMVTWVRGHFKDVHGTLTIENNDFLTAQIETTIEAKLVDTGVEMRDNHLRSADFLDVENHPTITYKSTKLEQVGENDNVMYGDLTIRGTTKNVRLDVRYNGEWETPWWTEKDGKPVDEGPKRRLGFVAKGIINRHDFKVSWQDKMDKGGIVVSDELQLIIDVEAYQE